MLEKNKTARIEIRTDEENRNRLEFLVKEGKWRSRSLYIRNLIDKAYEDYNAKKDLPKKRGILPLIEIERNEMNG